MGQKALRACFGGPALQDYYRPGPVMGWRLQEMEPVVTQKQPETCHRWLDGTFRRRTTETSTDYMYFPRSECRGLHEGMEGRREMEVGEYQRVAFHGP